MRPKGANVLIVIATLLSVNINVLGQQPQQSSIDKQLQKTDEEIQRLQAIKRRLEAIKKLQGEIEALQAGKDATVRDDSQAGSNTPPEKQDLQQAESFPENVPANNLKTPLPPAEVKPDQIVLHDCQLVVDNPNAYSAFERGICFVARNVTNRKRGTPPGFTNAKPTAAINLSSGDALQLLQTVFGKFVITEKKSSFILQAEEARTDKQVGGGPGNSGTTSLVVKGGVPSALGWAVENGAAVATTSGTTITFRFNPVGTIEALANSGYLTGYQKDENDGVRHFLRKTSIGVSFDANRGRDPGIFTGNKQQISALSFRYQFINERDPRAKRYQKDYEQFIAREAIAFTNTAGKSLDILEKKPTATSSEAEFKDDALQTWFKQTNDLIAEKGPSLNEVATVLKNQLDALPFKRLSPETIAALTDFADGLEGYLKAKKELLDKIAKGRVVTFEYTNNREVNSPDTSNFRFIAEGGTGRRLDLTANASLTIFNKKPVGLDVKRIRDFQFAGQLDVPVGDVLGLGQSVLSFGGRYERLMENAMTQAGTIMPNTKGDLAFGQVKLTIPVKGTGFKIPFSLTFANRTELIKEREVRGNFGFTFDLDTLFAKFKPF